MEDVVVGSPEHRVAVTVTSSDTDVSLEEVHVRVGAVRAATDGAGVATIDVPAGTYEVSAWKAGVRGRGYARGGVRQHGHRDRPCLRCRAPRRVLDVVLTCLCCCRELGAPNRQERASAHQRG